MGKVERWNIGANPRYLGKYQKLRKKSKNEIAWKVSQKFSKIINMIFGEIGFQKFNLIFKIKIIRSTVNLGIHRIGRFLINSENSRKKYLDRKYDFKKLWESCFLKFNSVCKLKIRESISGTGRHLSLIHI